MTKKRTRKRRKSADENVCGNSADLNERAVRCVAGRVEDAAEALALLTDHDDRDWLKSP